MKKHFIILIIGLLTVSFVYAQIPIEAYRKEIRALKTEKEISKYWGTLYKIDQEVLLNTPNLKRADSISISNMIKTALIFDIHGTKGYNINGESAFLSIINLSHNQIDKSQIAYWPVIERCKEIGGAITSFGGKYPAYQLESISLTFYNYSLYNQDQKYPGLLKKMSNIKVKNVVDELINSFENENEIRKLNEVEILNEWYLQSFKNQEEEGKFAFVKMSDNNLYVKRYKRLHKLELVKTNSDSKLYRIEDEPFGWSYLYSNNGSLSLIDDRQNELIKYTLVN